MRNVVTALFVILAIAGRASASPIVISDIVGGWQNATPAANATIVNAANQASDFVHWGGNANASLDSGYRFDPTDNPVGYTLGTPFALGVFTHINQPITAGTSITSIDYLFGFTTNGVPNTLTDTFHFDHNETTNSNPCAFPSPSGTPCDDIVTVSSVNLNAHILVPGPGGDDFFFNLLGFSTNGGATIGSQFFSQEGGSNSATLYGILTTEPIGTQDVVPEPASLMLMGTGMAFLARRLKKRSQ